LSVRQDPDAQALVFAHDVIHYKYARGREICGCPWSGCAGAGIKYSRRFAIGLHRPVGAPDVVRINMVPPSSRFHGVKDAASRVLAGAVLGDENRDAVFERGIQFVSKPLLIGRA